MIASRSADRGTVGPLQVLFLIRDLGVGGAQRQAAVMATAMRRRGHVVDVVTWYGGGALRAELEASGVRVHDLGKRSRWHLPAPTWRLLWLVRRLRPAIVFGLLSDGCLAAAAVARMSGSTAAVWGLRASGFGVRGDDWLARLLWRCLKAGAGWVDLVIANSAAGAAAAVREGLPAARIRMIPNGIDTERFQPDRQAGAAMRASWGVPVNAPLIGLVGRLAPMKDHPTFLAAAALLRQQRPEARFVCVGDGPAGYREQLLVRADALGLSGYLTWIRAARDLPSVYCALDVLTSCSVEGEAFSNAIGEAMACGVHCAVTDVGDSAAIVGETGAVWSQGDPVALLNAWHRVLSGPWPDPRLRIRANFGVDRMADRLECTLREVDDARRVRARPIRPGPTGRPR